MPRPSRFSKGGDFGAARESRFWTGAQPITHFYSRAWPVQAPLGRGFSSGGHTLTVGRIPARSLSAPKLMRFVKALQSPRHGRGYVRNRAEVSDWMNIPAQAKLELIG